MDRLDVVYLSNAKNLKHTLPALHDATIKNSKAVIDHIITVTVDEDELAGVRELEKRAEQVGELTKDAVSAGEKGKIEMAYLACLFLEMEMKKIDAIADPRRRGGGGGEGGGGGGRNGEDQQESYSGELNKAISFESHFVVKRTFYAWQKVAEESKMPGSGTGGGQKTNI